MKCSGRQGLIFIGIATALVTSPRAQALPFPQISPREELASGQAAEKSGRYEDAARHYENYLSAESSSPLSPATIEVRTRLATALFMLHQYDASLKALEPLPFGEVQVSQKSLPPTKPSAVSLPAQAWLVRGLDYLQLNQLPEAIGALKGALAINKESGTARLALGDALARSGRLEEAADHYSEQLSRTPNVADAWYKLGVVYTELAQKSREAFARQWPDNPLALRLAAEDRIERGDAWGAAQILLPAVHPEKFAPGQGSSKTSAQQNRPDSGSALNSPGLRADLGAALLQLGYPNAAFEEFKTELTLDPQSFPALLGESEVKALRSDWEGALNTFEHLMIRYPGELSRRLESPPPSPLVAAWKQGQMNLPPRFAATPAGKLWIEWLQKGGRPSRPKRQEEKCSSSPSGRELQPGFWLSEACYAFFRAQLQSHKSEKLSPPEAMKLIEAEFRLGDYDKSRRQAASQATASANEGWAAYWLAKSYSALSGESFDRLAALNPDSPRLHEILARHYSDNQQLAAARGEYEAALRLAPELPDLHLGLGTVYWQSGDWARAEAELKNVLRLSPGSAAANYELGDCYIQQHEWQKSAEYLKAALADPTVAEKARLDLAKAEAEWGDNAAALQDLSLLADGDRDGEVHYRLAMLYRKLGDSQKAQEALSKSEALRKASSQFDRQQLEALEHARENFENADHPSPK